MVNALVVAVAVAAAFVSLTSRGVAGKCPSNCPGSDGSHGGDCVVQFSVPCDQGGNDVCNSCFLWRQIVACETPGQPCKGELYTNFFYSPIAPPHHWLIEPTVALQGVETIYDGNGISASNPLWEQAWNDAVNGDNDREKIRESKLGVVINSVYYRSQHQMHIHTSHVNQDFLACLGSVVLTNVSWTVGTCQLPAFKGGTTTATFSAILISSLTGVSTKVQSGMLSSDWATAIAPADPRINTAIGLFKEPSGSGSNVLVLVTGDGVGDHNLLDY